MIFKFVCLKLLIFYYIVLINCVFCLSIKQVDPILWSTQNKMFETTSSFNDDKSIQKDHLIEVRIGEFLNIVCPKYVIDNKNQKPEYHALFKVSKEEYKECKINNIENKLPILKCDRPYDNVKYTLYISKFSPVPDAIEFIPGNSYYFISTSNGSIDGLYNSQDGTCRSNNMKIIIKVLDTKNTPNDSTTKKNKINSNNTKKITISAKNSSFYSILLNLNSNLDLQTRNIEASSMKIISDFKITSTLPKLNTLVATKKSITTKTVDDNIFILEPDSNDYNDILSQLISSSQLKSLNNSENLNDKYNKEPLEQTYINTSSYTIFNLNLLLFFYNLKIVFNFIFFSN